MQKGLSMFMELSGWIAIPVIIALFVGRWLDQKQGTDPLYFVSFTIGAFIISSIGLGITGVKYMKQIEKEEKIKKEKEEKKINEHGNKRI